MGDTVTIVAAVEGDPDEGRDFFPLGVEYREKTYSAGKFPGGFIKREGRPTTKEILTCRLIDRPIRPLFPTNYFREVQVMASVRSFDRENDPDILCMIGASAALHVSHIPFLQPTGSVRVGRVNGQLIILPTHQQLEQSDLDLIVAGTKSAITMIEGFAREMKEEDMVEGILFAHDHIRDIVEMIEDLRRQMGKPDKAPPEPAVNPAYEEVRTRYYDEFKERKTTPGKADRAAAVKELKDRILTELKPTVEPPTFTEEQVKAALGQLEERVVRDAILEGKRIDGRPARQVRPLYCEVGIFPRTHGSSIFQRGETQAVVMATLGTVSDEQRIDGLMEEFSKKFMLDYNMPPYAVGECRRISGPGRREIGHGMLAERSLKAVIPDVEEFPYTIRLVSEIEESNGSSSMASVCGGTLALMDAGVPIKEPVAGISIGLVKEGDRYVLLTDIMGDEDHYGDMDFKVAGTGHVITGIQLDLKIDGINEEIIRGTLQQAKEARFEILRYMLKNTLREPRGEISRWAPRLLTIQINPEKIGALIGPGGKNIKAIQESTGAKIDIEDDGTVFISHSDALGAEAARAKVEAITEEVKIGRVYKGKVVSIREFGAFIEIAPGKDALCHISELSDSYVGRVEDVVKLGDMIDVKVIAIDEQDRVKVSRKALLREQSGDSGPPPEEQPRREHGDRDRGERRDRGDRGGRGGDRGGRGGRGEGRGHRGDRGGERGG